MGLRLGLKLGFRIRFGIRFGIGFRIRFGIRIRFELGPPSCDPSKPPERSTNDQLPKRGVYRYPSLSEVKGTETTAHG